MTTNKKPLLSTRLRLSLLGAVAGLTVLGTAVPLQAAPTHGNVTNPRIDRTLNVDRARLHLRFHGLAFSKIGGGLTKHVRGRDPVVSVGNGPQATALDYATRTLYEANGNDNTVSVISAATCNAKVTSGCAAAPPTVPVGNGPVALAIDQRTDTIYVVNVGDGTVSVIDGATCNAHDSAGCAQTPPAVTVGSVPVAVDVNQQTDTVYVANWGNGTGTTVSVIDGATCNSQDVAGCGQTPASVTIGQGPDGILVDPSTDTVYAAAVAPDNATSVYAIDGATCNAADTSGCGQTPPSISVGNGSNEQGVGMAIDPTTSTLYVANFTDSTVSMIDKATCNATITAGCGQTAPTFAVGEGPNAIAFDQATHTIYTSNNSDWTVWETNADTCNAFTSRGCAGPPAGAFALRTGREPNDVTVDPATGTVYTPNYEDNTVSVLNGGTCNAVLTVGCDVLPRVVPVGTWPYSAVVNDATHTLYVSNLIDGTVSLINSATCNDVVDSGCAHSVATVTVGAGPGFSALDQATDTIYVPNSNEDTVSVIDGKTCNAAVTSGCGATPVTITLPENPQEVAVNDATDTVYVSFSDGTVAVLNGATCNATVTSGCAQVPAIVTAAPASGYISGIAVNQATNTIYTSNEGGPLAGGWGDTVSVINGTVCDAVNTTGCGDTPPTVTVGLAPGGVAADQRTNTVYVTNFGTNPYGFGPGTGTTVSMINGATCDAEVSTGCGQTPLSFTSGDGPLQVAVDQLTDAVYVDNGGDNAVAIIAGRRCNGTTSAGCPTLPAGIAIGQTPVAMGVSQATGTAYVTSLFSGVVWVIGPNFPRITG